MHTRALCVFSAALFACGSSHDSTATTDSPAAAVGSKGASGNEPTNAAGETRATAPDAGASASPIAPSTATPVAPNSNSGGSGAVAPAPSQPVTTTVATLSGEAIEIEQRLTDIRPEFVDFFWNNLDAEHFEQWLPAEHEAFEWVNRPKAPGDLGAEAGASFRSTELIGGEPHELVVTYLDRTSSSAKLNLDYAMVAEMSVDGMPPVRWSVEYAADGDWNLLLKQRLETPPTAAPEAWRSHLEQRMANLAGFLKSWFQKAYVETELMSRGQSTVTIIGDAITGDFDIVVEQHIGKVDQDMIDWWWDNIKDSMRYHRWHPIAHQQFTWLTPPKNTTDLEYDVGAVQQIVEIIGDSSTLDIGWLSPANLPFDLTYDHFVYGSTMLSGTPFGGFLLHEYANDPERGGINMKSTFRLPALAGMPFAEALAAHCVQEMQFLQYFLPAVFAQEYTP